MTRKGGCAFAPPLLSPQKASNHVHLEAVNAAEAPRDEELNCGIIERIRFSNKNQDTRTEA